MDRAMSTRPGFEDVSRRTSAAATQKKQEDVACRNSEIGELIYCHQLAVANQVSWVNPGTATGSTGLGPNSNRLGTRSSCELFIAQSQLSARPV